MKKKFYENIDEIIFVAIFIVIVAINACKA